MSAMVRYLLITGVLLGVIGTGAYINDTWISGDGSIRVPHGLAGTCLAFGLILVGVGLNQHMRRGRPMRRP